MFIISYIAVIGLLHLLHQTRCSRLHCSVASPLSMPGTVAAWALALWWLRQPRMHRPGVKLPSCWTCGVPMFFEVSYWSMPMLAPTLKYFAWWFLLCLMVAFFPRSDVTKHFFLVGFQSQELHHWCSLKSNVRDAVPSKTTPEQVDICWDWMIYFPCKLLCPQDLLKQLPTCSSHSQQYKQTWCLT